MPVRFKYRTEITGHTGDVRGICCPKLGLLLSASRDLTVRSWNLDTESPAASAGKVFSNHSNYVTAVVYHPPSSRFPTGLILSASNDRLIRAFAEDQPDPVFILHGHIDAVCALAINDDGLILSGSWDSTAKIWNSDVCLATVTRTGATIWAVLFLPPYFHNWETLSIVTGSSDSVISIWQIKNAALSAGSAVESNKPFKMLVGHTGCIRSLALLNSDRLLSASNDGSLRCWDLSGETCVAEFYGHTNFVYSVAVDPTKSFIVSSGEDRTVRVWPVPKKCMGSQMIECEQTLTLPCQTAWCVSVTADGDIAVGCSDKKIRIFSQDVSRQANEHILQAYEAELASSELAASSLPAALDDINIPGIEALLVPGKKDGHVSVIREGSSLVCYQWSAIEDKWLKVGDVVGSAVESATGTNRTLFEGKEYDFVFTVDFDESVPPVKLPFNKTDDPWIVAQAFLHRHNLPQDYLETVANYIIKNAGLKPDQLPPVDGVSDPFTGGGRYVPGSVTTTESSGQRSRLSADSDVFPAKEYITLESTNITLLMGKLVSFNQAATSPLSSRTLDLAKTLNPQMSLSDAIELASSILQVLPSWTAETAFPLFDLLRCLIRWKGVSDLVFEPTAWSDILMISDLQRLLDSSDLQVPPPSPASYNCILFVIRLLVNAIAVDSELVLSDPSTPPASISIIVRLAARLANLLEYGKLDLTSKRHHQVATAALLHNLSVLAHSQCKQGQLFSLLPALRGLPGLCIRMSIGLLSLAGTDPGVVTRVAPETVTQLLLALGTALVTSLPDPVVDSSEKVMQSLKAQRIRLVGSAASPGKCDDDELNSWQLFRGVLVFWAEAGTCPVKTRKCASALLSLLE